jgi:hypothetical protein
VASTKANDEIVKQVDSYTKKWAGINMERKGKLSTGDFAEMQKDRAGMVAYQDYLKGINDEMLQVRKVMTTNPGKLDEEWFNDAVEHFNKNGTYPPQGFASPSYTDPSTIFSENKDLLPREKQTQRKEGDLLIIDKDVFYVKKDANGNEIPLDDNDRAEGGVKQYRTDPLVSINVVKKVDKLIAANPGIENDLETIVANSNGLYKDKYEAQAGEDAKRSLWQNRIKGGGVRSGDEAGKGWAVFNNGISLGKGNESYMDYSEDVSGSMTESGRGIEFHEDKMPFMNVPATDLEFSDPNVKFPEGAQVSVKIARSIGNVAEMTVDPNKTKEISVTVSDMNEVPIDQLMKVVEGTDVNGNKTYTYTQKLPSNLTAKTTVSKIQKKLDAALGGKFTPFYEKWFSANGDKKVIKNAGALDDL